MPGRLGRTTAKGLPATAIMCVTAVSCVIPLLGRTAIGWIVDVTTIGAAIIYAYVSVSAYSAGKREKNSVVQLFGVLGALIAVGFVVVYLVPGNWTRNRLATESYLLLIIWSVLGMAVFRFMIHRDKERKLGKSEAVWIILLGLILVVSVVWIYQVATEEATNVAGDIGAFRSKQVSEAGLSESDESVRAIGEYINTRLYDYVGTVMKNVLVQISLIAVSLVVVFSIIKKREKQIEAERLRAEESNKAKSVFLSNMSHDIRTPMNAIMGYTALALNEELPDNVRGYLEKINTSGRHLLALINDILDMSRIESGKMELEPVPDDLAEILDEVRDMFAMQMEGKKLAFTVDYARITDRYVVVDRNRLNRILLNLISNALKFTPSGGSVTVTLAQTGTAEGKGSYELRVADTGIGMSKEFAAHIFDAFERERTETVSKIQGTGLGMSITKNLVELMGGTVTLQTEKDKGTEFLLRLQFPLASGDEVEKREKENETAEQTDFSGKKLLLAEDNPINSEIAKMILTHEGFEVDVAENGWYRIRLLDGLEGYISPKLVQGQPEPGGELRDLLYRDAAKNKSFVVKRMRKGVREARLSYRLLDTREGLSLLRIYLETGRSHQIRVQFASRGFPLAGDRKYGSALRDWGLALWSASLAFPHPVSREILRFALLPPKARPWDLFPLEPEENPTE